MQRLESGLIYNVLVKALLDAGITKVVTLHDALFLREQDADRARKIVKRELAKHGLRLKLKAK